MLVLFSVDDLPLKGWNAHGIQALPSIKGNGAFVQYQENFFELVCSSKACKWTLREKQLTTSVDYPVMMYLPQDYTC